MKKYISLLVCVLLLVGLSACGDDTQKDADTAPSTTQSTVTTTTIGEDSVTTTATDADSTTAVPTTDGTTMPTAASTGTGATTVPTVTTSTKAPSATAAGSQPTAEGSKSTSTATTTGTTSPTVAEPDVVLPAIGSDIDVANGRDRIRVSAATAEYNEDGTLSVSLTFRNYSSNWITEETNWVEYTCYDAAGNAVQTAKINIGCIDTKKNVIKTFTFSVPAGAAEVRLTDSKIVYWTEWS